MEWQGENIFNFMSLFRINVHKNNRKLFWLSRCVKVKMADGNKNGKDITYKLYKVSASSFPFPSFLTDQPEIWLFHVETQFKVNGIVSEKNKFNYLAS